MFNPASLDDVKDPCPVHDGHQWHLFGSGGTVTSETWKIFHATADQLAGPWTQHPLIDLGIEGEGVAAPGVLYEDGLFHMFIQTEFMRPGGKCVHLSSVDGFDWVFEDFALFAIDGTAEHGLYDPHPAIVGGQRYLVYSGMPRFVGAPQPDVYLARSTTNTWAGPWDRIGKIVDHDDLPHHNPRDHADYEWGIEGPQIVELPDGRVLLNATCFLPSGTRGTRQRVFLAVSDAITGPYRSLGPILDPAEPGENGHSTVFLSGRDLTVCYQSRVASTGHRWRYGVMTARLELEEETLLMTAAE